MRLTMNQEETLCCIVEGGLGGQILKPLPSLIKRGLVVKIKEEAESPRSLIVPTRTSLFGGMRMPPGPRFTYKLTQVGYDEYVKIRTKGHEARIKRLEEEFKRDLGSARAKLVKDTSDE